MAVKPASFLKEVKIEMGRVSWPSRQEVTRLTVIVVAVSLLVGVFIGALDFIFTELMKLII